MHRVETYRSHVNRELGEGEATSRTLLYVPPECSVKSLWFGTVRYSVLHRNCVEYYFVLNVCFCWLYRWSLRYTEF